MDEPLSNLDAKLRVQTRAELIKLHQRLQTTVIYVTHDQVEAMTMGHRIAVMRDGILQQLDTPQVLYDRPANMFVAGFIGSPAMNFFDGHGSSGDGHRAVGRGRHPEAEGARASAAAQVKAAVGREVVFGIRPEDIHHPIGAADAPDHQRAKVTVEVVEPLGSEQFVYLRSGNQEFTSRMALAGAARAGQQRRRGLRHREAARLRQADGAGAGLDEESGVSSQESGGGAARCVPLTCMSRSGNPPESAAIFAAPSSPSRPGRMRAPRLSGCCGRAQAFGEVSNEPISSPSAISV